MRSYEEEFKNISSSIHGLSDFALVGKKLIIEGVENIIKEGGNIIVGNHAGSYKDVATLFKVFPRPIFFTANESIFTRKAFSEMVRSHLNRQLGNLGLLMDFFINPVKYLFVDYISANIAKIGTIPVDLQHKKQSAVLKCQEYVKKGRAIIALQGKGRMEFELPNPYSYPFRNGPPIISYNIYRKDGKEVPVTPLAIIGTHIPWGIPGKVNIRIGEPMYITQFLDKDVQTTVNRFRLALEKRVSRMILDLLKSR